MTTMPNASAANPAQAAGDPGAGQAAQVSAPQQAPQADLRDLKIKELETRLNSGRTFYDTAKEYGLDKPETVKRYGPSIKTMIERGIDPEHFSRAFSEPEQEQSVEAKLAAMLDKREQAKAYADAEKSHWSTFDADQSNFADDKIEALVGKDAPKELKALIKSAMQGDYHNSRTDYEDGHPLHGKSLKPHGSDWFSKQGPIYKGYAEALKKSYQAATLAGIGDAANRQPVSTPAGTPGAGGSPSPNNNKRPGGLPSTADVQAAHDKIRARRGSA